MSKKPVNPEMFERWRERLCRNHMMNRIPAAVAMQCDCVLRAYHGGFARAACAMFAHGLRGLACGVYWKAAYRFCDKIGWTRLQLIPDSEPPAYERHAASCDKMNCGDLDCVHRDIPRWYRQLSGIARQEGEIA